MTEPATSRLRRLAAPSRPQPLGTPGRRAAAVLLRLACVALLRSDDATSAREVAAAEGVKFRGGTGSCVIDAYVTRIGDHNYQEIACLVQGRTSASVIVAAAPAAGWARAYPLLFQAVAAYLVR